MNEHNEALTQNQVSNVVSNAAALHYFQEARIAYLRALGEYSEMDLGDGCALVEFHSKMNSLGPDAIGMLISATKEAKGHFDALVVGMVLAGVALYRRRRRAA